jgi:translation initiation factor 4E
LPRQATLPKTIFNFPQEGKFEVKHPLEQKWTLWFDDPSKLGRNATDEDWKNNVKKVGGVIRCCPTCPQWRWQ